ncbi:hypothetical protein [Gaetbulibacter saemankumensis]|uniref:hypothetical protein n=1 Tax=Gaetbulibacter saemankumensis TaxID=311208 RepID=UPI0012FC6070|nr:hypothetical protein [Gaetbulibacter saemankumensis]
MKTMLRTFLLVPFFALLFFTSCQEEVVDITSAQESEALTSDTELTVLISATSTLDGSQDNVIDKASCLSVELPVTVVVNGLEIIVDSEADYKVIEAIVKEFDGNDDILSIVFPITVMTSNYTEITINSKEELHALVEACYGENEEDDDIECIDFQYPLSFAVYDTDFQVIDVVNVEGDRQLHRFIERVKIGDVFASLEFPVTMELADGSEIVVNNNMELQAAIEEAKNACDEDDDNDYGDHDFTKERLDNILKTCPWIVYEFKRNEESLDDKYREYGMVFKEDNIVNVFARGGAMLTGTWSTNVTDHGAVINLQFETLVDFTLEWFVYEIEPGKIKLFREGGNRAILKKNCEIDLGITLERIHNYLQQCYWRVDELKVDDSNSEDEYIGTPLKFFENNIVKIRVNGELVAGVYNVVKTNAGFVLQITLVNRPRLQLEWLITFLEPGLIKLEGVGNKDNKMILERHCPEGDGDVLEISNVLAAGDWVVAAYENAESGSNINTDTFMNHTISFLISGYLKVTNAENVVVNKGSWLIYRNDGLRLGLRFGSEAPFSYLNHRYKITSVSSTRIELKDFSSTGTVESVLVLDRKN